MRVEVSRRVGGVRLLLRKPFLEPMNEEDMRRLAEEARRARKLHIGLFGYSRNRGYQDMRRC
jgi:hypothetical protein